jgi:N-glycosylase/DNA lyase
MEFTLPLRSPFSLDYTLDSGQVFRWRKAEEWWSGVVGGGAVRARQEGESLRCITSSDLLDSAFVSSYFRLDDDLERVLASIARDQTITRAVERYYGLRLIRQERWECLASFVLATNANIPRIQKMVSAVCARYGTAFEFDGGTYHAFPKPEDLAGATVSDLRSCGLGYRAGFLRKVAASVAGGGVDFDRVASLPYEEARGLLLSELFGKKVLLGVGPKVADCVLLYSFGKDEAFPIDVWIARAIGRWYPRLLPPKLRARLKRDGSAKLSFAEYVAVSRSLRRHFGGYAGYAQQYLFMAAREGEP